MKNRYRALAGAVALTTVIGFGTSSAFAGAVMFNVAGDLALGVNDEGHMNTADGSVAANSARTGIAAFFDGGFQDGTSPGCYCEGWGVSANGTESGYASVDYNGISNITVDSFTSSATNITSAVHLTNFAGLSVVQSYGVSAATDRLFENVVTITNNTNDTLTDVKYVRVMDWDVPPTEFSEYVTIQGVETTAELELSHDDGFDIPDPLVDTDAIDPATTNVSFTENGPNDHGAYFRFNFGSLGAGETKTFSIFYGAAQGLAAANAAIVAAGLELYSYGINSLCDNGGDDCDPNYVPYTYIFGFKGVGGVIQEPDGVPEPMSAALVGLGLLGLGLRRKFVR